MKTIKARGATVVGMTSVVMLAFAPAAEANWDSYIKNATPGFESQRWSDEKYSEIKFTGCYASSSGGHPTSTDVQMWRHRAALPDVSYDNKTFTQCFQNSNSTSTGEWTLSDGFESYYFQIMKIGGSTSSGNSLDVSSVVVDTTLAD
ncbi:hypothetical protein [Streptomyces sp. NPDC055036]